MHVSQTFVGKLATVNCCLVAVFSRGQPRARHAVPSVGPQKPLGNRSGIQPAVGRFSLRYCVRADRCAQRLAEAAVVAQECAEPYEIVR